MTWTRPSVVRAIGWLLLALAGGCGSDSGGRGLANIGGGDWVKGGQTGALIPPCGLTPSAVNGDSIPGGNGGFVLHTEKCVNFKAEQLALHDEDGMLIAFDIQPLPGGAVLLKPRSPLPAGVYSLEIAGKRMEPVVAVAPAEEPTQLGTLEPEGVSCGADFALTLDPLVLEYLPQLKLSVSVDGGPEEVWFDYGTLDVEDGRAELSLEKCFPSCLADGMHSLHVTAELAGTELTLEPIDVVARIECDDHSHAAGGGGGGIAACGAARGERTPASSALLGVWLVAVALALRRMRRFGV